MKVFQDTIDPQQKFFLVVVDDTEEFTQALFYASKRSALTELPVALLLAQMPDGGDHHWISIKEMVRGEQLEKGRRNLRAVADKARAWSGHEPMVFHCESQILPALEEFIGAHENICSLIVGAGTQTDSPGPLVNSLISSSRFTLSCPLIIVPGHLSFAEIELHLEHAMP